MRWLVLAQRGLPSGRQKRRLTMWAGLLVALAAMGSSMIWMPGRSHSGPLPPLSPEDAEVRRRVERHVQVLAGEIGERNLSRVERLDTAARYLEGRLADLDLSVSTQEFVAEGERVRNVETEHRGIGGREIVVVGAHYDSVSGSPGANDNATGVAAVLEIARLLKERRLSRTIRFVFFVNEEPPYFETEVMGSLVYARRARARREPITAMLSIETIGSYSDVEGSQEYPVPLHLFYPRKANFIAFVGNVSSLRLVRRCVGSFRRHTPFPSEGGALPAWIPGIGWSDHWAFWKEGYPAVMVTDTALFRYAHYHDSTDTPDKVDYDRMTRVVAGIAGVVVDLAS